MATKKKKKATATATKSYTKECNTLAEIRAQCALVREGLLDGSISHQVGTSVSKSVCAESTMMREYRQIVELKLKYSPEGDHDLSLLE